MPKKTLILAVIIAVALLFYVASFKEEKPGYMPKLVVEAPERALEGEIVEIKVKFGDSRQMKKAYLILNNGTRIVGEPVGGYYVFTVLVTEALSNFTAVAVDENGIRVEKPWGIEVENVENLLKEFSKEYNIKISTLQSLYRMAPRLVYTSLKKRPSRLKIAVEYAEEHGVSAAVRILDPEVLKVAIIVEAEPSDYSTELLEKLADILYALAYAPLYSQPVGEALLARSNTVLGYTYSHSSLLKLPSWVIRAEIAAASEYFQNGKFDNKTLVLPWGEYNTTILKILEEIGVETVIAPYSTELKIYKYGNVILVTTPETGILEDLALIDLSTRRPEKWEILEELAQGKMLGRSAIAIPFNLFLKLAQSYAVEAEPPPQMTLSWEPPEEWLTYAKLLEEANSLLEYLYYNRGRSLAKWGKIICGALNLDPFWTASGDAEEAITRLGLALNKVKKEARVARSWIFWLQNIDYETLLNFPVDLAVIDPDDSGFAASQILEIRKTGKLIIAYLSIGEAEDYRSYWREEWRINPPEWLGEENSDWEGCYKVKYWHSEWREIVLERLNQIIKLGYDGVYLDVVDAYEYWTEKGYSKAREEMIKLVILISQTAKGIDSTFLIIPQNAVELVSIPEYLDAIDGVGKEDTWYLLNEPRPVGLVERDLKYLDIVARNNKLVLVIDYVTELDKIEKFFSEALKRGYAPYVGPLDLDKVGYYKAP